MLVKERIDLLPDFHSLAKVRPVRGKDKENTTLTGAMNTFVGAKSGQQPSVENAEARKFARYPRIFLVVLQWRRKAGKVVRGEGLTRDISAGGMFVLTGKCPPTTTVIRYEVYIPVPRGARSGLCIAGVGQVVRVERLAGAGHWYGFAVQFAGNMVRVGGMHSSVQ